MISFFKAPADIYDQIRLEMDTASGFPNDQTITWFTPAVDAHKDVSGNCLIACSEPISSNFKNKGTEISHEEYFAVLNKKVISDFFIE